MRRASFAFLLLSLAACSTYTPFDPRQEELPAIELGSFAGQEVAVDLRDRNDVEIRRGYLYDGLQDVLTRAGVRVVEQSPLQLKVKYTVVTEDRRIAPWHGCGRLEGQLVRNGQPEGTSFTSDYCNDEALDPWRYRYPRTDAEREDARERAYFGVLRVFLNDLEKAVAKG